MFGKRPLIPIAVLIVAALACSSFPDLPKNTQPDVARKEGECSDPRFKAAELAAYTALVQAQTDAANALKNDIDSIEATYKRDKSKLNDDYQSDLNKCGDNSCTSAAKADYDKWIASAQVWHDDAIYIAQGKEQAAIEAAQAKYYEEVEKARQKYCARAYKATGTEAEASYLGVICDLEKPFTVMVTSPYYEFTIQFTPSGPQAGSIIYTGAWFDVGPVNGDGSYTVQGAGTENIQLIVNVAHTTSTEAGDVHGNLQYNIDLFPLDTDECSQQ